MKLNNEKTKSFMTVLNAGRFYGLCRLLGVVPYCLYEHILHEFRVAKYLCVNANKTFIIDLGQISELIGIDVVSLRNALNKLSEFELIIIVAHSSENQNNYTVLVDEEYLNKLEKKLMAKMDRVTFENRIIQNQCPKISQPQINLSLSIDEVKEFVKAHFDKADLIPMFVWSDCSCLINCFETASNLKFTDIPQVIEQLDVALAEPNFKPNDMSVIIEKIIDKILEPMDVSVKEAYKAISQFCPKSKNNK